MISSRLGRIPFGTVVLAAVCSLSMACGARAEEPIDVDANVDSTSERLFADTATLWPSPSAIPVCWETPGFATEKGWVQGAIKASWETAAPHVHFTGWGDCTAGGADGLHIAVRSGDPDGPHTIALGAQLAGVSEGMILDFAFSGNDGFDVCLSNEAKRERCVRAISTHEFGHALGFLHEQERPDTPASCQKDDPGPVESPKTLGTWDLMSIMNYCYPDRDTVFPIALSPGDIAGLLQLYPPPKGASTGTADDTADPSSTSTTKKKSATTNTGDDDDDDDSTTTTPKKKKSSSTFHPAAYSSGCSAASASRSGMGGVDASGALGVVAIVAVAGSRRARRRKRSRPCP